VLLTAHLLVADHVEGYVEAADQRAEYVAVGHHRGDGRVELAEGVPQQQVARQ